MHFTMINLHFASYSPFLSINLPRPSIIITRFNAIVELEYSVFNYGFERGWPDVPLGHELREFTNYIFIQEFT